MPLASSGTVSERHEAAREDADKLTAGELASAMRKAGLTVKAAELNDLAPEWHHAGWKPGGGMGRCFFFPAESASAERMAAIFAQVEAARAEAAQPRYGWRVEFEKKYDGPYGRKRFQPVAGVRVFAPGEKMPDKWESISEGEYLALYPFDGRELEAYESRACFLARMSK